MVFSIGDIIYFNKVKWYARKKDTEKLNFDLLNKRPTDDNIQVLMSDYRLFMDLCINVDEKEKDIEHLRNSYDYWIITKIIKTISGNKTLKVFNSGAFLKKFVYVTLDKHTSSSQFLLKL
jgi:hypothetical protein